MQAECPECAAAIALDGAVKGEIITCAECGAEWSCCKQTRRIWLWRRAKRKTGASKPA